MGLFSFLKKKVTAIGFLKAPINEVVPAPYSPIGAATARPNALSPQPEVAYGRRVPTVKSGPDLLVVYDIVFFTEMATITAFSKGNLEVMHRLITQGEGGYLNQARYQQAVFDQFFLGRNWSWPWFEKWNSTFSKLGEYPSNWANYRRLPKEIEPSDVVQGLKVGELKELLTCAEINYPTNAKKASLIEAALASPETIQAITSLLLWSVMRERVFHPQGFGLYTLLMRTILVRVKSFDERQRQIKLRMTNRKLFSEFPADQKFAKIALAENPDALCPLYPGDVSFWKAEIPGFESR